MGQIFADIDNAIDAAEKLFISQKENKESVHVRKIIYGSLKKDAEYEVIFSSENTFKDSILIVHNINKLKDISDYETKRKNLD